MKKSTYNRCSETVSMVKKSTASTLVAACARRKARQESAARWQAGPSPAYRKISLTVVAETARPRPCSSPTIR